jgi:hypothetical protein
LAPLVTYGQRRFTYINANNREKQVRIHSERAVR